MIIILLLLNACMQNTAFLGPAVTVASTGNIGQAGISYSTNKAIKKITGKSTIENIESLLEIKKDENKIVTKVKKKIRKVTKINDLTS